jgi:glycosyltransferase involved in cell wall biosynthesis
LKQLSLIIPAYNEERSIVSTIGNVREMFARAGIEGEILVVDDGSTDATGRLAAETGAKVIFHGNNRGYGAALKTGIQNTSYEKVAITDADGTYPVQRIPDLLCAMSDCEMVVGARTGETVKIPLIRKPAKWVLRKLANRITGTDIPDLNSGLRIFRRNLALRYMRLLPDGFSFTTTITVASLCDGINIKFIPIDYYSREGSSKIKPSHFPSFLMLVLRLAVLFRPLRVFLPVSSTLFLLGFFKLVLDVFIAVNQTGFTSALFSYPIISTTTVIFLVSSLQVLLVGMVAEALAAGR